MLLNVLDINSAAVLINHGKNKISSTTTPTILGIIARVISWIWVTAWKMETARPKTNAVINKGAASLVAIVIASVANETTNSGVIFPLATKIYDFQYF